MDALKSLSVGRSKENASKQTKMEERTFMGLSAQGPELLSLLKHQCVLTGTARS